MKDMRIKDRVLGRTWRWAFFLNNRVYWGYKLKRKRPNSYGILWMFFGRLHVGVRF